MEPDTKLGALNSQDMAIYHMVNMVNMAKYPLKDTDLKITCK